MATTITQYPNKIAAAYSPMVVVLSESSSAIYDGYKFRYIVQVFINDVEKAKLKFHKNESNDCVVDIAPIVQTYIETQKINIGATAQGVFAGDTPDGSIHEIGVIPSMTINLFSQTTKQMCKVTVKAGYEVATSATTAPSETLDDDSDTWYAIPATTPRTKSAQYYGGLDEFGVNNPLLRYRNYFTWPSKYKFFTNAPSVQFVRGGNNEEDNLDYLTVCLKQGDSAAGSILDVGSQIAYMKIEYFDKDGNALAGTIGGNTYYYIENIYGWGGSSASSADTPGRSILYFGCGTMNLQHQTASNQLTPTNHTDWACYRISGHKGNPVDDSDRVTRHYYFYKYGSEGTEVDSNGFNDRHQSCTKYENIRLTWRNKLGAWDYFNFRGKSIEKLDISRESMGSVEGTWGSTAFNYNNWDRGISVLFTEAKRKLTISTDYLNEDEAIWLEELFTSTDVNIIGDNPDPDDEDTFLVIDPVIIKNKSYTKKNSINNKVKIQYTLELEYAHNTRTNS